MLKDAPLKDRHQVPLLIPSCTLSEPEEFRRCAQSTDAFELSKLILTSLNRPAPERKTRHLSSQKRQEGTRWDGRTVRFLTIQNIGKVPYCPCTSDRVSPVQPSFRGRWENFGGFRAAVNNSFWIARY
ncbi:uncharacterized protein CLUP02_01501 [Colletotrichum lupini]|uniref:Uncharacterized protein n=1 Tax=Colletotrichum lupini TaxID=145971 RepID=A0A9Q8SCR8_9PEZI|nr:uncharacterized protein CLUP02_01501 [Colletotrichum lupini]UQC74849.1 hypothetical protein CLUP02_01501 [Colletotrichum lupini]